MVLQTEYDFFKYNPIGMYSANELPKELHETICDTRKAYDCQLLNFLHQAD